MPAKFQHVYAHRLLSSCVESDLATEIERFLPGEEGRSCLPICDVTVHRRSKSACSRTTLDGRHGWF